MKQKPVIFLDSGVGGLPYCEHFYKLAPHIPRIYIADRANFPYGPKSREELGRLLKQLVARALERWEAPVVVIACNTATISAIDVLRTAFPEVSFVGTVPAVKPAVLASKAGRIGVIATERTISEPYIYDLARRFNPQIEVIGRAAPELVSFVEHDLLKANREERLRMVRPAVEWFRQRQVDGIVLGCTHFLFLLDEFQALATPDITIFHSVEGVARRVLQLLETRGLLTKAPETTGGQSESGILAVTGTGAVSESWHAFSKTYGLVLEVWE
ncbi:glutamate racemase [Gracilinema caldarium]|uniref:glutamate racemase n=1 Tax=Gracilinema caldarium TaxID=215591 RepID=UPI0026EABC68|nr:glutamate racemase [Gracilinema caldarium]